jgi:hypothetical protein
MNFRDINFIRHCLTWQAINTLRATEGRMINGGPRDFIKAFLTCETMKRKHRECILRVYYIQKGFSKQLKSNQARFEAIKLYWIRVSEEI